MAVDRKRTNSLKAQTRTDEFLRLLIQETQMGNEELAALLNNLALEVTLQDVNLNVDDLERSNVAIENYTNLDVWDSVAGNSKEFTYYSGISAENPSGEKNVESIIYKTGVTTVVTRTFTWDADDDVLSITAS
jgi:hypothetical protein